MVIVMDMSTGKIEQSDQDAAEFGAFDDEVLNAGWLPQPAVRLELHEHTARPTPPTDVDAFLHALYLNQE